MCDRGVTEIEIVGMSSVMVVIREGVVGGCIINCIVFLRGGGRILWRG